MLWSAQSLSAIGDSMMLVAVPFAALKVGGSPTAVGLVFADQHHPANSADAGQAFGPTACRASR